MFILQLCEADLSKRCADAQQKLEGEKQTYNTTFEKDLTNFMDCFSVCISEIKKILSAKKIGGRTYLNKLRSFEKEKANE